MQALLTDTAPFTRSTASTNPTTHKGGDPGDGAAKSTRESVGLTLAGVKHLLAEIRAYNASVVEKSTIAAPTSATNGDDPGAVAAPSTDTPVARQPPLPTTPITTTADAANLWIKPATVNLAAAPRSYVALHPEFCAPHTVFCSHTWGAEVEPLLSTLVEHGELAVAEGRPPPSYYLDVASVDQHEVDQVGPAIHTLARFPSLAPRSARRPCLLSTLFEIAVLSCFGRLFSSCAVFVAPRLCTTTRLLQKVAMRWADG